jgi:hypothetical protein
MLWGRISIRARCTTLCDKVCQWLATGRWFSPGPPVSSTNKTDRHNIVAIVLKVALSIIKQTNLLLSYCSRSLFCFPISPLTFPKPQSYFQVYRFEPLNRNESGRFGALRSDSTHNFFRNACTKSGSLRFLQFSGCWLILSVYIIMSFDFPFLRLFGVR